MSSHALLLGAAQRFTYHLAWSLAGSAVHATYAENKQSRSLAMAFGVGSVVSMVATVALHAFGSFGAANFALTRFQIFKLSIPTIAAAVFFGAIVMKKYGRMTPETAKTVKNISCGVFTIYHAVRAINEGLPLLGHSIGTVRQGIGMAKSAVIG